MMEPKFSIGMVDKYDVNDWFHIIYKLNFQHIIYKLNFQYGQILIGPVKMTTSQNNKPSKLTS